MLDFSTAYWLQEDKEVVYVILKKKKNNLEPRILYSTRLSFKYKGIGKVIFSLKYTSSQKICHRKTHIENILEEVQK